MIGDNPGRNAAGARGDRSDSELAELITDLLHQLPEDLSRPAVATSPLVLVTRLFDSPDDPDSPGALKFTVLPLQPSVDVSSIWLTLSCPNRRYFDIERIAPPWHTASFEGIYPDDEVCVSALDMAEMAQRMAESPSVTSLKTCYLNLANAPADEITQDFGGLTITASAARSEDSAGAGPSAVPTVSVSFTTDDDKLVDTVLRVSLLISGRLAALQACTIRRDFWSFARHGNKLVISPTDTTVDIVSDSPPASSQVHHLVTLASDTSQPQGTEMVLRVERLGRISDPSWRIMARKVLSRAG